VKKRKTKKGERREEEEEVSTRSSRGKREGRIGKVGGIGWGDMDVVYLFLLRFFGGGVYNMDMIRYDGYSSQK